MHYRDFTLVLSEAVDVGDVLEVKVQVTEAAGLPTIIEPVRSHCGLAILRLLSNSNPRQPLGMAAQLEAGSALGRALLPGVVGQRVREALTLVRSREEGLRIRITGGDVVHCAPWEYSLLPPEYGEATETDFLALMPDVSIVRDQSIPLTPWSKTALPFRIAATASHPVSTNQIDVGRERALLQEALRDLKDTVELTWSVSGRRPSATTKAQMFHFAGHGDFMPIESIAGGARDVVAVCPAMPGNHQTSTSAGYLVFEGADGLPDRLSAGQLGVILREMGVRVAVLNACKTGSREGVRSWNSVAAALLKAGVRSVVAMQYAVLDASAIAFAAAFYRSLAIGGSLDEAARNGRMAIFDLGDNFGWGTPVLYLCAADGHVFPEAQSIEANRTVLRVLDQQIRQSYQSRVLGKSAMQADSCSSKGSPTQRIRLHVIEGPDTGRMFTLEARDRFMMGRAPNVHFQVMQDTYFSRHHFMIEVNSPNVMLQDLRSTNGTFVNGTKVHKSMLLYHGDIISGGDTRIKLEFDRVLGHRASISNTTMGVTCLRCGAQARHEQPRLCDEVMAYFCGVCQDALFATPTALPGYRIVRELGRGCMGAVYLATHPEHGLRSIKLILPRVAISRRVGGAFIRDLATCSDLKHKNIVRTFECCEISSGMFCVAMEYVNGSNCRELIRQNPRGIDPRYVVRIALQMLEGLAYAHERHTLHRDIKDSNLLVGRDGHGQLAVKISDFGLAKPYETLGVSGFIKASDVPITAPYMSPERILDFCNVTPLADLYSAGAVLYHLLTGEYAFEFQPQRDPVITILEDEVVPIAKRSPWVPTSVAAIIERAMCKDPVQRFRSADNMRQALLATMGT